MNSDRLAALLQDLVALGPRPTGSTGEAAAARWTGDRLREAGLTVDVQPFAVSRWPRRLATRVLPAVMAALLVVCGWLVHDDPWQALGLLAAASAAFLLLGEGGGRFAALFDLGARVTSANVVGRVPASREGRPVLLLSAHLDSRTQLLPLGLRIAGAIVALLGTATLAIVAAVQICGAIPAGGALPRVVAAVAAAGLAAIALDPPMPPSPGALDDGAAVALLVELARELRDRAGGKVGLVFLATGAEELGMAGALRFVQRSGSSLNPARTLVVNLDILGRGGAILPAGRPGRAGGARLVLADGLRRRGLRPWGSPVVFGAGMDHQRFVAAGLPALSLTQGAGGAAWFVHTPLDRLERVDVARLAFVGDAIVDLADHLAASGVAPPT